MTKDEASQIILYLRQGYSVWSVDQEKTWTLNHFHSDIFKIETVEVFYKPNGDFSCRETNKWVTEKHVHDNIYLMSFKSIRTKLVPPEECDHKKSCHEEGGSKIVRKT